MTWQTLRKRVSALALAAVLTVTLTLPAAAVGDGVVPTYDEAYYATLDYYGNLVEGSMVKSYALNGRDSLTDYGVYDEVVNLTDDTAPVKGEGGSTSFRFAGGAPDHFYFEGKTKEPFANLPWTVTLRYTLNGVPAKAEELAGKQGVVEIFLDIVPNENAGDYARYNYTLAATALFNQDDILSLEAEGAQVQLVGNLRTVLFLCLPGEEQHFTIRVGSNDFSFGGLTILMVPATLAQLEEIAKLSQRKDDLEEDYRALSGSLDGLLDALSDIQSGLYASAKGLDQLEAARSTFSGGKGALYAGTDRLREDLSGMADLLEPVEQRVQALSRTVTDSKAVLNEMTDATLALQDQLADMEQALSGLERGTYDVKNVIDLAADMENSLLRLERALGGSHVSTGSVATNSKALVQKVKTVHGAYAAGDTTEFLEKILVAQGEGEAAAKAKAAGMSQLLAADAAGLPVPADQQANLAAAKQLNALHTAAKGGMHFQDFCGKLPGVTTDQAKQMNDLWLIYSSGDSTPKRPGAAVPPAEETPEGPDSKAPQIPADPAPKAPGGAGPETPDKEAANAGGEGTPEPAPGVPEDRQSPEDGGTGEASDGGAAKSKAPAAEKELIHKAEPEAPEEAGTEEVLTARLVTNDPGGEDGGAADSGDSSGSDSDSGPGTDSGSGGSDPDSGSGNAPDSGGGSEGDSGGGSDSGNGSDSGSGSGSGGGAGDGGSGDGSGQPPKNDTVGGAVVDLITDGLDSASARIDAIQGELMDTLRSIEQPTSAVVGRLADLCAELAILVDDLDDAEDLMAALRQSSGTLREILIQVDELRTVLNGYEPTLQEALANAGSLSSSAAATIRDAEALLADAEGLARDTGKDLDAGTRQSLKGLSAALRQTAKALAATGEVRDAKNTVADIIEDTWNEYTGDVNNILLMDATAEPVSLTDERNPAPTSIQVLIRTQEIKQEEEEEAGKTAAAKAETTFWGRIAQMFRDFWNAVTGIFR